MEAALRSASNVSMISPRKMPNVNSIPHTGNMDKTALATVGNFPKHAVVTTKDFPTQEPSNCKFIYKRLCEHHHLDYPCTHCESGGIPMTFITNADSTMTQPHPPSGA